MAAAKDRRDQIGNVATLEQHRERGSETVRRRAHESAYALRCALESLLEEGLSRVWVAEVLKERGVVAPSDGKWTRKSEPKVASQL